jgi:lipopolysaccharide export system protein LptA
MKRGALAIAVTLALAAGASRGDDASPNTSAQAAERLGLRFTRDAELVITSDEAEGTKSQSGRESVVFSKHVKARQGDMRLECDWLEAVYPQATAGRPDKISARGTGVIKQGTNEARCTEAQIDNVACTAECRSSGTKATLHRGTDDVEADTIYFDLCKGTVKAVGSVEIRVREKPEETPASPPAAPPAPGPSGSPREQAPAG